MYSLVNAPVLCMDLVRHGNTLGVLDVLDRALLLAPADMVQLAAVHRDDTARDRAWAEVDAICGTQPRMSDAVAAVSRSLNERGLAGLADEELADQLSRTMMFGLPHLLAMVRTDVLDWTWEHGEGISVQRHPKAIGVVVDALAASYARDRLSVAAYARLGSPWVSLHKHRPTALPGADELGPQSATLRRIVDELTRCGPPEFAALEATAASARRAGASWSLTMHNATWAAYLSGRLRVAARAQFAATRAVALAGLSPLQAAGGVMRAVSAAVQGLVVCDVLDEATLADLLGPYEQALGSLR